MLAAFLTLATVRGDAERGLLQPLVVRPIGRPVLLLGRFLAAAAVCAFYVAVVYAGTLLITWAIGDWMPDRVVGPALQLAAATAVIAALSLLGSVFLSATANGIAVFMVFGAGLVAGLLGQIGEALDSETLMNVAQVASWAPPLRGALPGRARCHHRGHDRLHRSRPHARAVRRRPGGRPLPVALDVRSTSGSSAPPRWPHSRGRISSHGREHRRPMKNEQEPTRSQLALLAALARNRGELDASTLERLLKLVAPKPEPSR